MNTIERKIISEYLECDYCNSEVRFDIGIDNGITLEETYIKLEGFVKKKYYFTGISRDGVERNFCSEDCEVEFFADTEYDALEEDFEGEV